MNKAAFALTTIAAMTAASVTLAQGQSDYPGRAPDGAPTNPPPQTQPAPVQPGPAQPSPAPGTQPMPPGTMPPAETPPLALPPPGSPPAMTRITSAEPSAPMLPVHRVSDTVTVRQSLRPNRPLLYTGGLMFIGAYGTIAALTGTRSLEHPDKSMYIPVAGPWMHLKDVRESPRDTALIVGSGLVQAAGLGITVMSFIIPEKVPVATIQAGDVRVHVTATSLGRGSAGIGAVGQF